MKNISIIAVLFCSINIIAQNYQVRKVDSFNALSVFGSVDVELFSGNSDSIKLESDQLILDDVTVKNEGQTLRISLKENIFDKHRSVKVKISKSSFKAIKLTAGAEISSAQIITGDTLSLASRNGANITLKIEANRIISDIGEGSTVSIEGKCNSLRVDASSGGLYNGYEMKSEDAVVKSNAGAIVKVYATNDLDAYASTGGQVSYRGEPKKLSERTVFGGKIEKVVE